MKAPGRLDALERRLKSRGLPPEARRQRIRELCAELGYTLPPEDDPSYPAAVERLAADLRAKRSPQTPGG